MPAAYTILRDGSTCEPLDGTIVVATKEHVPVEIEEDLDNGDPRSLHEAVEAGELNGTIYNVEALVALYEKAKKLNLAALTKEIEEVEA